MVLQVKRKLIVIYCKSIINVWNGNMKMHNKWNIYHVFENRSFLKFAKVNYLLY